MTNDDDLRTALTKLADMWGEAHPASDSLRTLLAAHPAPETAEVLCLADTSWEHHDRTDDFPCSSCVSDTRREDMARVRARAIRTADIWDASGEQVIEAWDGEQFTTADLRALAVLPAPPVVDEATVLERAADDMEAVIALGDAAESTAVPSGTTGVGSAIGARDALYEDPVAWLRTRAARLRGATRG